VIYTMNVSRSLAAAPGILPTMLSALLAALMLAACGPSEESTGIPGTDRIGADPGPARETIDAQSLLAHIETLASDEFGGRAPLSEGERLTIDYLETEFRTLGLQPMFGDSFLQPVPLVAIEADPNMPLVITDEAGIVRTTFDYGAQTMLWTTRVAEEVDLAFSELVWVGYGIVAPEYGWDDYQGLDVSGKTVVMLVNDPGFASGDENLFKGRRMTYYGRWTYKYEEAARQGAAGALIVHQTEPAAYGWNVVEESNRGVQFHLAGRDDELGAEKRLAVQGWLQEEVARQLLALADRDFDELRAGAGKNSSVPLPLGLRASVTIRNRLEFAESYNVGAVQPGTMRPEELFIYMAHWDHLGTAPHAAGESGDFIYNGAEDNASGTSGLLEIANAFSSLQEGTERSVGFLAVTAEESGLLGSEAFVERPPYPMHHIVGGINMDRLNFRGVVSDVVVIGHGASELEDILAEQARPLGRTVTPEATPEKGYYYRSDHFNFAKRGVPILYARGGTVHRQFGADYITRRNAEYVADRYHATADEVRDDWDLDAAVEDLRLFFDIGQRVADSDLWPNWYEGNEFRAIRDASLAADQR
jgi:Zn-dependent M28 family amino/carboxypeptidase